MKIFLSLDDLTVILTKLKHKLKVQVKDGQITWEEYGDCV